MAQNFAPYLIKQLTEIAGQATPELKIQVPGFINLLKTNNPFEISVSRYDGTKREVRIGYGQRFTEADTTTSKSCDLTIKPAEKEVTVSVANVRQLAFHISDEDMAQYMTDATQTVAKGKPATDFMNKMVQNINRAVNALLKGVDKDLLTLAAASFGNNIRTGNNASSTINISKDGNVISLTDGLTLIMSDYGRNQFNDRPKVVGSGLFHNFMLQQQAKSANQAGLNSAIQASNLDFFYDENAATILGANQIGVYEPGAVQMVEYLEYTGAKAGKKPGASSFGVIGLPLDNVRALNGGVSEVELDFQLMYNDCPKEFTDTFYGTSLPVEKGWNLILSKRFGLFTIPTDAYKAQDELTGNRGSLRYTISNDCDTCE